MFVNCKVLIRDHCWWWRWWWWWWWRWRCLSSNSKMNWWCICLKNANKNPKLIQKVSHKCFGRKLKRQNKWKCKNQWKDYREMNKPDDAPDAGAPNVGISGCWGVITVALTPAVCNAKRNMQCCTKEIS